MKRPITLLLALLMVLSLVACGNPTNTEESSATNEQTESSTLDSEKTENTEESTEPVETETPTESEEETPAFDTSWASNEFEAVLPQLPFSGWTAKQDGNTYKMELGGLKTETKTDADGNTIGYGEDKTAIINYVESLKNYGFTVEETGGIEGYVYEWSIKDASGNEVEVTCAEGYCWIEIVKR